MTDNQPALYTKYNRVTFDTGVEYEIETPDDPGEPFFYITIDQVDSLIELLQQIKAEHTE